MKIAFVVLATVVTGVTGAAGAAGAAALPTPSGQQQAFDVASIKHTPSDVRISEFQMRAGGRLFVLGMTLRDLIRRAYGQDGIERNDQIVGGADWVRADRFDVQAGTDADVPADLERRAPRMLAMLRTLLADRFHLTVHTEQRETDVYALALAKPDGSLGPGIHASSVECRATEPGTVGLRPGDPRWCGFTAGRGRLMAKGQTMKELAGMLSNYPSIGRAVRDASGLPGRFDFQLEFASAIGAGPGPLAPSAETDSAPDIFTALQEQLGLKLQNDRARIAYVVVDRAELPTEN